MDRMLSFRLLLLMGWMLAGSVAASQAQRMTTDDQPAPVRSASYAAPAEDDDTQVSLVERYRRARLHMLSERMTRRDRGRRPVAGPVRLPVPSDTLRPNVSRQEPTASTPSIAVQSARPVRKLERGWFQERFAGTRWSFLGAGRYMTPADTTMTRVLRAKLQAHFGNPTQVLADFNLRKPRDEYVQFEYWLVVNDSIPVKITDANGALDRGLIVATSAAYREHLFDLRQAILAPVVEAELDSYVDYYFETETRRWYRTGYDGQSYFLDPISRYRTTPGRRPWIDPAPASR